VNVWTNAVIRGDDDSVIIGRQTTILEHCLIEAPAEKPVRIGEDVLVSHGAIVHGAQIGNKVLVGIGAIVLDGVRIGDGSIIGSGALVPPRTKIPARKLVIGIPARLIRDVETAELDLLKQEHDRTLVKAEKYRSIYQNYNAST